MEENRNNAGEMVGISSYGVYIPEYRLERNIIAKAWSPRFISRERAVASYDENGLTMAVEAAENFLLGRVFSAISRCKRIEHRSLGKYQKK